MKRLIFLLLIALVPLEISAQSRLSDKGYVGDVSLSASFDSSIGAGVDLLTSHGYSFGNGLWLGGGTGVCMADKSDGMMLPIYTEARYSFLDINDNAHPFVGCKMGYITDFDETISFISPTIGVEFKRFSYFASYKIISSLRTFNLGISCSF